jgi:gamma-glutamyltranspeptidase / glutathione hydrolase
MIRSQIATSRKEVVSERGVVACGHMQEAEAGAWMLEEGGNAVDAVVAAAFTCHVVEPDSRIPEGVQEQLRELGHIVVQQSETPAPTNFARVSAVARDPATGELSAGSSPP